MIFWIVTAATALIVSAALIAALLRGRTAGAPPAAYDLAVYRDQLKDVERDLARGTLNEGEAERIRAEVGRRVLAADAQLRDGGAEGGQPPVAGRVVAGLIALALIGGSLALYGQLGAPGYSDLPRATRLAASQAARADRLSQAEAEAQAPPAPAAPEPSAEFTKLMERLRAALQEHPDDPRGLRLLAQNEATLGNMRAAITAQTRLIDVLGEEAQARDYAMLADLMITAAGGYVSSDAEGALRAALDRDPDLGPARYYLGLYLAQVDRPDAAFRLWESLLREGPPDAPWIAPIRAGIGAVAASAGVDYTLPDTPGPDAAAMDAASEISPEARGEMIRGMVEGLAERLAAEGGAPGEWARLIAAYGVLGERERAARTWAEAQETFAGDARALEEIRAAADRAGVAQ
ncbi:c-type cytochrome biogenesis protein CcmI [Roseovarius spongiae]|uniref:C-type cytochrome biogenesis protein CcmI n=1 Tax=Roseovarius spongiae TaxID=2320272 RepID=A0A3A8BBC0_9RHOB|nr:c-type cytochrome biogenesis protein CcmI [Roseovarius spongiae]RKF16652.1 c-type cytochrome biogenesis protein CcmI [Roseovarius spongiae]